MQYLKNQIKRLFKVASQVPEIPKIPKIPMPLRYPRTPASDGGLFQELEVLSQIPLCWVKPYLVPGRTAAIGYSAKNIQSQLDLKEAVTSFLPSDFQSQLGFSASALSASVDRDTRYKNLVVTNSSFANRLLSSKSGLKELAQTTRGSLIFPIFLSAHPITLMWSEAFGPQEYDHHFYFRWFISPQGEGYWRIYNSSGKVQEVEISFQLATAGSKPSEVFLIHEERVWKFSMDSTGGWYEREFQIQLALLPGENRLSWQFVGEPIPQEGTKFPLCFAVRNPKISFIHSPDFQRDARVLTEIVDTGLPIRGEVEMRNALHKAGFFDVQVLDFTGSSLNSQSRGKTRYTQDPDDLGRWFFFHHQSQSTSLSPVIPALVVADRIPRKEIGE